jgi:hypothetical protein
MQTIIHWEGIENQTEVMNVELAKDEKSVKNLIMVLLRKKSIKNRYKNHSKPDFKDY